MSRLRQKQNIDNLIQGIRVITESQCSLSDEDRNVLNEANERLQLLKRKKGKTNEQILKESAKVVGLLVKFFVCETGLRQEDAEN